MSTYRETLVALRTARADRDEAKVDLYASRVRQLQRIREQRGGGEGQQPHPDDANARLRSRLLEREKSVSAIVDGLFRDHTPQRLIAEWNDGTPILLLPLRVETKFREENGLTELCVRIFPDEIAVNTHEKVLTEREEQRGVAYWKALRAAANEEARKDAWRSLADKIGANRAAWVALQTKPLNWSTPPPATDDDLQFPPHDLTKPDPWSEAPHTRVLPDRFVLTAYRGSDVAFTHVGAQISDVVVLGPAPLEDDGKPSITRTADNRLDYGQDLRWLTDFQDAVDRGLGFRIPLSAADAISGFSQLLVLGVKLSADQDDARQLVEDLIDNHHYSAKGFSLVRQGSPTNNTNDGDSRFGTDDWLHDVSYFVETGEPLFKPEPDPAKASDAQRLADALGIDPAKLQYIGNADAKDHAEAVAMNRALYAGTLGYYLHSMLNEVMSDDTIAHVRELFTENVTGRGPLPAIRVGNQPYGVLLTSAFPRWAYPDSRRPVFAEQVRRVLLHLNGQWQTLKPQLRHIGKSGNARENLMNVLGLQPTSADYYQRVGYSFDYLKNLEAFTWGGDSFGDVLLMAFEQFSGRQFLRTFGYRDQRDDGTPKPVPLLLHLIYRHYHTRLDRKNLIDALPLSEERTVKPYDEGTGKNYIDWLFEHAKDVDALERQNFGTGVTKPNALLYMMLLNALLHEAKNSIHGILKRNDIASDELLRSRKFMNISSEPDVSHWEVFRAPAHLVLANETVEMPLLAYVHLDRFASGDGRHLKQSVEALDTLRQLPTARLERLLTEHVDTLNYRLDSWQSALFERRLIEQRAPRQAPGKALPLAGVYLGSYGYLEHVRPAREKRVRISERMLPEELREGTDNLYTTPRNGGYVHTPSLNHATAAAILRNGYLTHATPEEREKLSVNLSSERVRRAKYLVDGVRNGQSLEALLGYLFERGMHDWTTRPTSPVILDQLKPAFRKAFPIKRTKMPRQGFSEPAEVIEDFTVVNGLDLARMAAASFPSGIADLPPLSAGQLSALRTEKANIENTLDALRDVLTAECAYQLALGNFDRAAAVMQALSEGQVPVEIEVIHSSRGTELGFTNRVTIQFDALVSANPWTGIPMTRRARTESALNHWIGQLLGNPETVRCTVTVVDEQGNEVLDGVGDAIKDAVTLAQLGLQPIDIIYLARKTAEDSGPADIERRVRHRFARARTLPDPTIVRIEFANAGAGGPALRSFAEILPFADTIREVIGKARPLHAQDFTTPSKTVAAPSDNPGNVDAAELAARVTNLRLEFDGLFNTLKLEAEKPVPDADLLRTHLIAIADGGFVQSFPFSSLGVTDEQRTTLVAQSRSLLDRYEEVKTTHDADLARLATMTPPQKVTQLTAMARRFLGDDFVVLPRFTLLNVGDVTQADANRDHLLDFARDTKNIALPVDEWLHGVSLVRPSLHTFARVLLLSETFNGDAPPCSPLQLPFREHDTWLGIDFPAGTNIVHDTLSIVQCTPQGFQPAAAQSGLLVDEWMETLPKRDEVTGITFHYDQPNSVPPAALLLAVTPRVTGAWQWDDLTATVLDTMERAKLRAVEPDMIETLTGFAALIPSTIAEFSTGRSTISLDFLLNLEFISLHVAALAANTGARP